MSTLQQLLDQKAELDKQIESTRKQERSDAIAQVKTLMDQHGLVIADLGLRGGKTAARKGSKVAAKYRNNATGETWSGRGLQPKWLKSALESGRKIDDFAV
jgi:DNA-binding protein H-NS